MNNGETEKEFKNLQDLSIKVKKVLNKKKKLLINFFLLTFIVYLNVLFCINMVL